MILPFQPALSRIVVEGRCDSLLRLSRFPKKEGEGLFLFYSQGTLFGIRGACTISASKKLHSLFRELYVVAVEGHTLFSDQAQAHQVIQQPAQYCFRQSGGILEFLVRPKSSSVTVSRPERSAEPLAS